MKHNFIYIWVNQFFSHVQLKHVIAPAIVLIMISAAFSCGNQKSDEGSKNNGSGENPSPIISPSASVSPAPTVTTSPVGSVFGSGFWVASSTQMLISRYDTNGNLIQPVVDLKSKAGTSAAYGGITALNLLDQNTLLAFHNPYVGSGNSIGNTIYSIDLRNIGKSNAVNIWKAGSVPDFATASVKSFITGIIANTVIASTLDGAYNVQYSSRDDSRETITPAAFSSVSISGCNYSTLSNSTVLTNANVKSVLILSSGSLKNLTIIKNQNGVWNCGSAYDYSADSVTTSGHTPVNALQGSDGKVYVLYQHATASKIVSYTFDGTSLSAPTLVFGDQGLLGMNPMGMALRSADKLIFGNRDRNRLYEISIKTGSFAGLRIDNSYVNGVSTIISN